VDGHHFRTGQIVQPFVVLVRKPEHVPAHVPSKSTKDLQKILKIQRILKIIEDIEGGSNYPPVSVSCPGLATDTQVCNTQACRLPHDYLYYCQIINSWPMGLPQTIFPCNGGLNWAQSILVKNPTLRQALIIQYITARLNVMFGVPCSAYANSALTYTYSLLSDCSWTITGQSDCSSLTTLLKKYNTGLLSSVSSSLDDDLAAGRQKLKVVTGDEGSGNEPVSFLAYMIPIVLLGSIGILVAALVIIRKRAKAKEQEAGVQKE